MEILRCKQELLGTGISGEIVFYHWRCGNATEARNSDLSNSISDGPTEHPKRRVELFSSNMCIRLIYAFTRYLLEFETESRNKFEFIGRCISILARLDAFSATVIPCFCSDETHMGRSLSTKHPSRHLRIVSLEKMLTDNV